MSFAQKATVACTATAGGAVTAYSPIMTGQVINAIYTKTNFSDGAVLLITGEDSGIVIWSQTGVNSSAKISPVQVGSINTSGAASSLTENPVYVANERIKIAMTGAGNGTTGSFTFIVA